MTQKVFLNQSGKASFSCPECGKTRQMDVSKFKNIGKEVKLKVTCACKHKFPVILERRQYIRKQVALKGKIYLSDGQYHVQVINISRYGMRIKTNGALNINLMDKVILEVQLDDATQSIVKREMIVKTIKIPELGLEFVEKNHYDKLGSYLLFHLS